MTHGPADMPPPTADPSPGMGEPTPGRWEFRTDAAHPMTLPDVADMKNGQGWIGIVGPNGEHVCDVFPYAKRTASIEQARGNAFLLRSAPALVDALSGLLDAIGGWESTDLWCVDARAAIAIARGETPHA